MKFMNRETEFPGRKKLIKVDENNTPLVSEIPVLVNVVKDEGIVYAEGTPISAENLNKGNWRDDDSLSFKARGNNTLPSAKPAETQVITKANGRTWIIPPTGFGEAMEIADSIGTSVKLGGNVQKSIEFETDPQVQITTVNNRTDATENLVDASLKILNGALDEKLDRMNAVTQRAQVYTKNPNGTQQMLDCGSEATLSGIVTRAAQGHIKVPSNPSGPDDSSSRSYVDAQRDTRVARVTNQNVVYGTDGNGNPLNRTVNTLAASAGTIVERIAGGQITVPASPSAATDAASKQYVDQHSGLYTGTGVCASANNASPLLSGITSAVIAEGARIRVRFTNGVNRNAATQLTVNGAASIVHTSAGAISATNPLNIPAGESRVFVRRGRCGVC